MIISTADKPSAPINLHVSSSSETSVALQWNRPHDDGGSPINHYVIEKRDALRMTWQPVGTATDTHFSVSRLAEGVSYIFRVIAENRVGRGKPAELSKSVAAKSPYSK